MANNTVKMAISLPKEDFIMIEKLRRELNIPRSTLIDQAIRFWFSKRAEREQIHQYEQGYRKKPEKAQELRALERAQMEVLPEEDWT